MRKITHIVLHCTATPQTTTVKSIQNYWKNSLGWKSPGYHHIIKADGEVVDLLPIDKPSNGVAGHNMNSIHISYIGGVDAKGKAVDNRTQAQICSQIALLKKYKAMFPDAQIVGHRDFPGVSKSCPSFDVKTWLKTAGI
jgi:N-acetylmuramoyl-L-alanine amidase